MNLVDHLYRQREWSQKTFGTLTMTEGVLDHIRSELDEVAANPDHLSEWIDIVLLAFDGALRRGFTPNQIATALEVKQMTNEKRTWPDKTTVTGAHRIEHVAD